MAEYKFTPILLNRDEDKQSAEAAELAKLLIKPALFENIDVVVPLYPLVDIEESLDSDDKIAKMCHDYALFCYKLFNFLTLVWYPFAVCQREGMRFLGAMVYYFVVVPSRYWASFFCHPCLDSVYRLLQPFLTFCVILTKPVSAIAGDCFGAVGEVARPLFDAIKDCWSKK